MEEIFSKELIASRLTELGKEITDFYRGKELTVIVLMNGGAFFGCDLARAIDLPLWFDSIRVSSYINDVRGGKVALASALKLDPAGREILLLDDVFDSGETIKKCKQHLLELGASGVRCAVLVNKNVPGRESEPEWAAFDAPDKYLIGFGMDSYELYRNLPFVGVM